MSSLLPHFATAFVFSFAFYRFSLFAIIFGVGVGVGVGVTGISGGSTTAADGTVWRQNRRRAVVVSAKASYAAVATTLSRSACIDKDTGCRGKASYLMSWSLYLSSGGAFAVRRSTCLSPSSLSSSPLSLSSSLPSPAAFVRPGIRSVTWTEAFGVWSAAAKRSVVRRSQFRHCLVGRRLSVGETHKRRFFGSDTKRCAIGSDATVGSEHEEEEAIGGNERSNGGVVVVHDDCGVITPQDVTYMSLAVRAAEIGLGYTFPNPAVGCVLVRTTARRSRHPHDGDGVGNDDGDDDGDGDGGGAVIGCGFHPRAGLPHAEIFALLEACGHVQDGVEAAQSCLTTTKTATGNDGRDKRDKGDDIDSATEAYSAVMRLLDEYTSEDGPAKLFGGAFSSSSSLSLSTSSTTTTTSSHVTAYVTLEPCCHHGKRTPPCASTLVLAGVNRVVIGRRDPNPKVDGGGVSVLRNAGIVVDMLLPRFVVAKRGVGAMKSGREGGRGDVNRGEEKGEASADSDSAATATAAAAAKVASKCADIIENFEKRVTLPRALVEYDTYMNGAKRMALRRYAGREKANKSLKFVSWPALSSKALEARATANKTAEYQQLDPMHMNLVDDILWKEELVLLRLGNAVHKKRDAKELGRRIATDLDAHVAQVVGHTALLYRPSGPDPILDLDSMVMKEGRIAAAAGGGDGDDGSDGGAGSDGAEQ